MVRPERTAGLGDFDNRIGQHRRFDLGGAPGKFHANINALLGEVITRDIHKFGGDDFLGEILRPLERRVFGRGQHPAHFAAAALGVDQVADRHHFQAALDYPVEAGKACVDRAVLYIAGHLLGTDQQAIDVGISRLREI